jgi:hypothetical protein
MNKNKVRFDEVRSTIAACSDKSYFVPRQIVLRLIVLRTSSNRTSFDRTSYLFPSYFL